jgi:hypothetical protein
MEDEHAVVAEPVDLLYWLVDFAFGHSIPHPTDRFNPFSLGPEFFPQSPHVGVHGAGLNLGFIVPNVEQEVFPRLDPSAALHQQVE